MRPSLTSLADIAREAAAGSPTPAGQEPPTEAAVARPGARERAAIRRRARKVTRTRDALVRDLGVLVVEMERLGRRNDELLAGKAREIAALDDELRGLRSALHERMTLEQLVAAGIAGSCLGCGSLLGTEDRFCSHCGTAAGESPVDRPVEQPSDAQLQIQTVGAERR
jgi:hypothetical protein